MMTNTMPPAEPTSRVSTQAERLAQRLEKGARALEEFARSVSDAEWSTAIPGDGRKIGVVVHHVASVYPIEIQLAKVLASGAPVVDVTWDTVHTMNAGHAREHDAVT